MLKKILFGSAIVMVVAIFFVAYRINSNLNEMSIDTDNVIDAKPAHPTDNPISPYGPNVDRNGPKNNEPVKETEDFYTLLIGLDTRGKDFTLNTDSLIVAHIIPQNKTVKLVSIPRDTKVVKPLAGYPLDPGDEFSKINAIFAEGYMQAYHASRDDATLLSGKKVKLGENKIPEEYISSGILQLRNTVNTLLDIDIRYSYLIDFQTLVSLVDAVNGITVDVERNMDWDDEFDGTHIHLKKGVQKLDGQQALDYARFRRDNRGPEYDSSDLERGMRQLMVIQALVDKLTDWGSVTKALNLLDIVTSHVKTDMPQSVMASLTRKYYGHFNQGSIQSLDFKGYWESPYIHISDEDLQELKVSLASLDDESAGAGVRSADSGAAESDSANDQSASSSAAIGHVLPFAVVSGFPDWTSIVEKESRVKAKTVTITVSRPYVQLLR